ncbi:recombinase family protein [Paenibacillus sp.]|uniref:recombinase family protein n=1 Tax=Paenibacillus sp. TaxID=58172 RepID=UPI00356A057C
MENQQQTCVKQARVALYARTNQAENEPNTISTEHQVDMLIAHCKQEGKEIIGIYSDDVGASGIHIMNQHSLLQLLETAKQGLFDEVLVWKIDRLARKTIDVLQTVDMLEKYNVNLISLSENFDASTRMGRFTLQMIAAVGELGHNSLNTLESREVSH